MQDQSQGLLLGNTLPYLPDFFHFNSFGYFLEPYLFLLPLFKMKVLSVLSLFFFLQRSGRTSELCFPLRRTSCGIHVHVLLNVYFLNQGQIALKRKEMPFCFEALNVRVVLPQKRLCLKKKKIILFSKDL